MNNESFIKIFILGKIQNIENKEMEIIHIIIRIEKRVLSGSPVILKIIQNL